MNIFSWAGAALRDTLRQFEEDEEIPVVSRVAQFQQRDRRQQDMPERDYDALATAARDREPAPSTPKVGTTVRVPSTKKDHDTAKKLQRSERLNPSDATRRYLFEERILKDEEKDGNAPSFTSTDEEKEREVLLDTVRQAEIASWGEDRMMTKFSVLTLTS